jgi:chromosome segregation ATPase
MTSPQDLGQRVERTTQEIDALYDITQETHRTVKKIATVQQHHGNRMTTLERTLDHHTNKFNVHTNRLNSISSRLNHIEAAQHIHTETLNAHSEKLDKVDARLDKVDGRLDKVDGRLDKVDGRLDKVDGRLGRVETAQQEHSEKLDKIIDLLGAR